MKRKIIYIDVGDMSLANAEALVAKYRNEFEASTWWKKTLEVIGIAGSFFIFTLW